MWSSTHGKTLYIRMQMEIQREKNRVVELTNEAKKLNELTKVC